MKIIHITLCGPYTDNWNYQENLLAKYHKKMGLEVCVIASTWAYNDSGALIKKPEGIYFDKEGVKVYRIGFLFGTIDSKLKRYKRFTNILENEKPDIVFVHGCQFLDVKQVVKYVKHNSCTVYVDNHADFSNCGKMFVSRIFLHRMLWAHCFRLIEPYAKLFYGVLPARVDFLKNIYRIPEEKIRLLLMGGDDDLISSISSDDITKLKRKMKLSKDDFVLITGGKIDAYKTQVLNLMRAIYEINNASIKLIIFGSVDSSIKKEFDSLIDNNKVIYVGWVEPNNIPLYFAIANAAVFPGRHSVLWEQAAAQGLPLIVKYWEGTTHIDCGGNVLFLKDDSPLEVSKAIGHMLINDNYELMKQKACKNKESFLYSGIAKKSIEEE